MHLTMCTMVETTADALDNNQNVKLFSENDQLSSPNNMLMDTINEENNDSNDSNEFETMNADGRHSSSTFVISLDNRCGLIDIDERERLAHENCDVGDDDEDNDNELKCYSSHIPIDIHQEMPGESPYSNEHFGAPIPTPIQLGINDILSDEGEVEDIKQKKYPVLPSIGKTFDTDKEEEEEEDENDPTLNQLDYSRERMETEADFFADYRVNTSVVKPTPRTVPLPPIGQTYTPRNSTP